jgi:flavin reductase (DIM6/NTAB) family NADH-FMN oxidoreductase RutF
MTVNKDQFRAALGRFASGITIVTTTGADGTDMGMTVSAFSSVSLTPPLVLVCIANDASMIDAMRSQMHFAVNILASEQEPLSRHFSGKKGDRFEGVGYQRGQYGCALLDETLANLECRVVARTEAGDHLIVVGEALTVHVADRRPLLYYRGGYAQLER